MKIAVVGAGPSGLTAALRLIQQGHEVSIFEKNDHIGGRTRSVHFNTENGENHIVDTGAGWLTSFYVRTLSLIRELKIEDQVVLKPRGIRGASQIIVDSEISNTNIHDIPMSSQAIKQSSLLTNDEKNALQEYLNNLLKNLSSPNGVDLSRCLSPELHFDERTAQDEYEKLGENVVKYLMGPLFEGPFFCQLNQLSSAMTNAWLQSLLLPETEFYQVSAGMDSICKALANQIHCLSGKQCIFLNHSVQSVEQLSSNQVLLHLQKENEPATTQEFAGIVLAIPAPQAIKLMPNAYWQDPNNEIICKLLNSVKYSPHVRVYASRKSSEDINHGYHLIPTNPPVATIECFSSNYGAWGSCPQGRQWALVCATAESSKQFCENNTADNEVSTLLWSKAKEILPQLFPLEEADVVHIVRWPLAIPIFRENACSLTVNYKPSQPIAFAGDWTVQACVEGAIRSGERAANAFRF